MNGEAASAHGRRGSILLEQQRFPEAEGYFRQALAVEPNDPYALANLALCELRQGRARESLATIQSALALAPEMARLHVLRAFCESELDHPAEALAAAAKALELSPENEEAHVASANVHFKRGEWARAENSARAALALNPDHIGAANQLSHALRLQNRLQESEIQIDLMLSRDPENADTHRSAGWTALQSGDRKRAEAHFLEALRLDPRCKAARDGLKEAFRAKSPPYRVYLAYCFFLQRTSHSYRMLLLVLVAVAVVLLSMLLGPYAMLVIPAYFLLVLWSHVARAVGNFQLSLDRFARHALTRGEAIEAWFSGGAVVAGIPLLILGIIGQWPPVSCLGATLIGAAIPLAYTFTNRTGGKWLFGAIGGFVLVVGTVYAIQLHLDQPMDPQNSLPGFAILGVIAATWLSKSRDFNRREI